MPFIVTAFTTLGTAIGLSATAAATFGSVMARLLVSTAISALQSRRDTSTPQGGLRFSVTQNGGTTPCSFPLGATAVAGQNVCPPMSHGTVGGTPNAYLTKVIELSDIPGCVLKRVAIDGDWVTLGSPAHAEFGLPVAGKYAGRAWIKYYDGTQVSADAMLLDKYGSDAERPWKSDMVGTGLCYVIATFQYDTEVFRGEPSLKFEMGSIPLYDPRKDSSVGGSGSQRWNNLSTWLPSDNPIVQDYNTCRGIPLPDGSVWGGGFEADDLPLDSAFAAMNACDALVSIGGALQEKAYRSGYEVAVTDKPFDVREELLKACDASPVEIGGAFKVRVGAPGVPTIYITDGDIVVTSPQDMDPFLAPGDIYNGITASYPDPEIVYASKEAPPRFNTTWETRDGGRFLTTLSLPAVPYRRQVQRLMKAAITDHQRGIAHNLTLSRRFAAIEPGDVVSWTSARNQYSGKLFEVTGAWVNPLSPHPSIALREVDPSDYDFDPDVDLIDVQAPSGVSVVPSPQTVPGFGAFAATIKDASGAARRPAVQLVWLGSASQGVKAIKYQIRVKATGEVIVRGAAIDVVAGERTIGSGILAGVEYQARGRQNASWPTVWTSWFDVVAPDVRLGAPDLADEINTAIADAIAEAEAAALAAAAVQAEHDALTTDFVGDLKTAFTEQTKRAMATSGGWLVDPTFTDWVSGNLNAANWASRAGTSAYAVEAGGDFGGGMTVSAPSGSSEVQIVASSAAGGGLIGANVSADYAVLEIDLDYSVGNPDGVAFRVEWSSDGVTWTRGTFGGAATSLGLGTAYGLTAQAGTRQSIRGLWKRPAGVSGHIRLRLYPKLSTVTDAQSMVIHYANLRAAQRADIDAGDQYLIASSTPGTSVAYTGAGAAIAGLNAAFSARAGGLEANVTNILGVRADLLTGTAFGALLTQLAVNTGTGLSATVTVQGAAIATLEGNASASLALRVKAGSGGALLELTAADNPTGPASFARIVADDILLAGSVTTKQMLITDGNLFGDSLFLLSKDESVYTRSGLVGTDFETYTSGWAGFSLPQVLQLKAGIGYNSGNGGRLFHKRGNIEGVPGSSYHFSCYVGVEAGGTDGQTTAVFSIYIYKKSVNGTLTYARSAAVWAASNAASGVLSGSFTLAKDENVIVPVFRAVNETGGVTDKGARFNNPVLRRMNGGELVVDGGITAQKLSVPTLSAITADVGILRTATSGARLEIRGDQILVYDASGTLRVRMGNLA